MNRTLDERVRHVIERINAHRAATGRTSNPNHEMRLVRARILEELPRLLARLTDCISDLNDRLGGDHVWISLNVADRTPTTEAVFTVQVEDGEDRPDMMFNVDYTGRLTVMLTRGCNHALSHVSTVFDADRVFLLNCLLELLEARYPAVEGG